MRKTIAISLLTGWLAATSAFGQGYFAFTSGKNQVYDCFTVPTPTVGGNVRVSFLWAAAGTTPVVDIFLVSTPTSANTVLVYTIPQAWAAILNGQFNFATNAADNSLVKATLSSTGVINYNGGSPFGALGTTPNTTYTIYEVGWDSAYANPWLAAAAQSAVGWSNPIQYTAVTSTFFVNSMIGQFASFGVFGVPEPTTMTLAALGGLSLLAFRRFKK